MGSFSVVSHCDATCVKGALCGRAPYERRHEDLTRHKFTLVYHACQRTIRASSATRCRKDVGAVDRVARRRRLNRAASATLSTPNGAHLTRGPPTPFLCMLLCGACLHHRGVRPYAKHGAHPDARCGNTSAFCLVSIGICLMSSCFAIFEKAEN